MIDAAAARLAMVEGQVRTNDVTDVALLDAMRDIPRELFAPKAKRSLVYGDLEVEVGPGRYLTRPRDFAKLIQALDVRPSEVVLDLASGRGYGAAVLSRLADAVVGVDGDADLIAKGGEALIGAGCDNAALVEGDVKVGYPSQGPYDVIHVNGAVETVPTAWFDQLADRGRLGVIVRRGVVGHATIFTKAGGVVGDRVVFESGAPVLPGFEAEQAFTF